jgi:hypothetical protein
VDISERFFEEARRLYDCENGRRSPATIQGLLIMFAYTCGMGRDRAGKIFQNTAYEMLNRLKLETGFREATCVSSGHVEQKALSRALWGIYCFER